MHRFQKMMFAPDDGTGSGPAATVVAAVEPQTFSREYVTEVREEAKGWRLKATEMTQAAATAREQAERATSEAKSAKDNAKLEADAQMKTFKDAADARVVRYALHAAAKAAGLVDMDGLKLLETSTVKVGDDGEVTIPADFFSKAKESKPWLFGQAATTTTSSTPPPKPADTSAKKASEMTDAEYAAAKAEMTRRR